MESEKMIFISFFAAPLPEFPCFSLQRCLCVKARTSDIHLGQKQKYGVEKNSAKNLLETIS